MNPLSGFSKHQHNAIAHGRDQYMISAPSSCVHVAGVIPIPPHLEVNLDETLCCHVMLKVSCHNQIHSCPANILIKDWG